MPAATETKQSLFKSIFRSRVVDIPSPSGGYKPSQQTHPSSHHAKHSSSRPTPKAQNHTYTYIFLLVSTVGMLMSDQR